MKFQLEDLDTDWMFLQMNKAGSDIAVNQF